VDLSTSFAFVLALMVIGALLARTRAVGAGAPEALNQVVLLVCLPAAVLLNIPKLLLDPTLAALVVTPWLLLVSGAAAALALARGLKLGDGATAVLLLGLPLGNTSFLGYPLIAALVGPDAVRYAVLYDQLGSFLMLSTYGLAVLARYAHGTAPTAADMVSRVARFPPFVALVVAFLMPAHYPPAIELALARLADALLPLVALALGMQLKLALPREHRLPLVAGLAVKLALLPLLALGLASVFGLGGDVRAVLVLESAMPTMMTGMALAGAAGLAPELAAALVGYGTVLAMATLPLWRLLL
jgi:predicted permease